MKAVFIAALLSLVLSGNSFAGNSLYINNNEQAEYKIINLSAEDIKNLAVKDDPVLIFKKKSETLKMVSGGDLLVAGACREIPNGFIRKVISVKEDGSRIVIETIEAGFEDMLRGKVAVVDMAAENKSAADKKR
ncbi:MAG: hypothetical protein WC532_04575 [Candidatus Omnitrophota bacterium]